MMLVLAVVVLAVGTLAFRLAGPTLRARVEISPRIETLMMVSVAVLFAALVATSSLVENQAFAGYARPAGVLVGGVLAWRKAPFVAVVLAAAGTAAVLRLLGVP
ncbi:AzlD domain-containing protein [Kibdelosporangium phytohabitans]|uniref:Branched-chain amino acid transporter n=1 Tax=Kibdelosporangium phytohabitans TaxID=860235 RepID=A0A0N9I191_9PSEU|nr:AzlD domain-containing protein [Kibdelosporangium phytohabitans]ALG11336.1 branched-chain amino acid transporter [Kibdelosporangium phytohabitans]MBE1462647.1 branched-subunit amino acid transport protein [Kibdelosporangium phytohabitans]